MCRIEESASESAVWRHCPDAEAEESREMMMTEGRGSGRVMNEGGDTE
jgi:hypothetical protein